MSPPKHVRWPASRFYWAVLDASVLPSGHARWRRRAAIRRLGYLFERYLPGLAIEDLHAAYERLPGVGERYLACGLPRAELEGAELADAVTLTPETLPPFVEQGPDAARFNLLTGPFVPRTVAAGRRRWAMTAVLGVLLAATLLATGFERRRTVLADQTRAIAERRMLIYEEVLGQDARHSIGTGFPPELRLLAELRQLEETRSGSAPASAAADGSVVLAQVLASWPRAVHAETESLSVAAGSVTLSGRIPSMAEAQTLASALARVDGWRVNQPQTEARGDGVQFTLRLEPARLVEEASR